MSRTLIAGLPGQTDINNQFTAANIAKTVSDFKGLYKNGDYTFGTLTAKYYNMAPGTPDYINWMEEVALYDKAAREKIKKAIIAALHHQPDPVSVLFTWEPGGSPQDVITTENSSPPSYTVKIIGYPAPAVSALAARKKKT